MANRPENPQPLQSVLFDSFDPDSMTDALQRGALDHVQLARGRFRGSIQRAQASAAYSVVLTSSMARLRSGLGALDSMGGNLTQMTPGGFRSFV